MGTTSSAISPSYPVYAAVSSSNAATAVWSSSTSDVRPCRTPTRPTPPDRTAAGWSSIGGSFTVDINLPDGNPHVVSIYADDWDNQGRSERVDVINPSTGAVLDSRTISSFEGGVYLSWQLTGNIELRFTALAGPNAVLSGIFFQGPGQSQYDPTGSPWTFSGKLGHHPERQRLHCVATLPHPAARRSPSSEETARSVRRSPTGQRAPTCISFDAAQRENSQAYQQNFSVLIDGQVVGTFTPSSTSYQSYSTAAFTVTAGAHTITFQGLDSAGGDNTVFLDQVAGGAGRELPRSVTLVSSRWWWGPAISSTTPSGSAWTFSGSSGISGNNSGFTAGNPSAPQGSQVAFLQGTGSFSQTVSGWAAGSYVITFDAAQRDNIQAPSRTLAC